MRISRILILLILLFFFSCMGKNSHKKIDLNKIHFLDKHINYLSEGVKIIKIVKLETKKESLIGSINKVIYGAYRNFYVGDFYIGKKIIKFDKDGQFLRSYGREGQGPGEFSNIIDFGVDDNENVIILTQFKLIKFNKEGNLVKERRIFFLGKELVIDNGLIYLYVLDFKDGRRGKSKILLFDMSLKEVGGIGEYDKRLEKYLFVPLNVLSKGEGKIYFTEIYDFKINIYDTKLKRLKTLMLPYDSSRLEKIFMKDLITEKDREYVKNIVHRFNTICSTDKVVLLSEYNKENKILKYWLFNFEESVVYLFSDISEGLWNLLSSVKGCYKRGFIAFVDNKETINVYNKETNAFNSVNIDVEENPVLILFEFNKFRKKDNYE